MMLQHFVLTRFSYRRNPEPSALSDAEGWFKFIDPLDPKRLEARFKLFATFCLPSILGQRERDFCWVIIVDPALGDEHRARLAELTRRHATTRIVDYDHLTGVTGTKWLSGYISPNTTHLITTNIDDDDLVSVDVVHGIQSHLRALLATGELPSCKIIGCRNYAQWDFMPTRRAPLGYKKGWHRGNWFTNTTLTFCARYPEFDLSVLGLVHVRAHGYFDPGERISDGAHGAIRATAERLGEDWRAWSPEQRVHTMQGPHPEVIVLNHLANTQYTRLFEAWSTREPVTGPEAFPGMVFDPETVRTIAPFFKRSLSSLARWMLTHVRGAWQGGGSWSSRKVPLSKVLLLPLWYMVGLPERTSARQS